MEFRRNDIEFLRLAGTGEAVVSEFVGVMGKLRAVIEEENAILNSGLPATLLLTTERKGVLSQEYDVLGGELVGRARGQILSDPALQEKLLTATAQLCALSEENRDLLDRALAASRRRIDAVMDAVRASESDGHGDDGSVGNRPG